MSFFSSIFGHHGPVLGVDIGTTSIKIAELDRVKQGIALKNYGILEAQNYLQRFNEALQTSSLKLSEKTAAAYLRLLLERGGFASKTAVASVPAFLAFSTLIEVPAMSESELKKFIELQAKQYVPLPLNLVSLDWMKVGERKSEDGAEKNQILIVSIPNEVIELYKKIFHASGLTLAAIEIEGMSAARSAGAEAREAVIIVDIGSRSTSFSVIENGLLKFSGQTDFAGASITHTIATGLNISEKRAEDLKRERGLLGFGGEHELSTLIEPILDVIMSEAKRVINTFQTNYRTEVKSAILAGGGANLIGIEGYFNKKFGLASARANFMRPFLYPASLESAVKETGPVLAVAVGLALKNMRT